jgi:hypothetical protein
VREESPPGDERENLAATLLKSSDVREVHHTDCFRVADREPAAHLGEQKNGGGKCYGYSSKDGTRSIVANQAKVIRQIFAMYADGAGPSAIADELNRKPCPWLHVEAH